MGVHKHGFDEAKDKKDWMETAFSQHQGKFSAKAKAAGKSTAEYAREEAHAPGVLGKEARLAEIGMKASHNRRTKK